MQRSSIMKGTALLGIVFGVPLMLAPNALLALYGAPDLNMPGVYNSMLYGACMLAIAVMNWLAASQPAPVARPVVIGTFVMTVLGSIASLERQLTDQAPPAAWMNVVLFVVLLGLYAGLLRAEGVREKASAVGTCGGG